MAKKLIHIRKPQLRITSKGVKLSKPSARIGGKTGINVSGQGVSGSIRTKAGSLNTKKGCRLRLFGLFGLLGVIGLVMLR